MLALPKPSLSPSKALQTGEQKSHGTFGHGGGKGDVPWEWLLEVTVGGGPYSRSGHEGSMDSLHLLQPCF